MTASGATILLLLRNLYYLRNFEAAIRGLAERGHRITILADPAKSLPAEIVAQKAGLETDFDGLVSFGDAHGRGDFRQRVADDIHTARDILRYYAPAFRDAGHLRRRAIGKATPLARMVYRRERYRDPERNRRADEWLERLDRSLPIDSAIAASLDAIAPDLLVVSPLVDLRTNQIDWVRAARARGTRTVLAVASWDNLTSKARIQTEVDRVIVWNETQKREAIDLHGVDESAVAVTGAQLYDGWFGRQPESDRATFCSALGLDPARPIVLYVGSSTSIARDEPAFIRRWLEALRSCSIAGVADANVLIRPHPMNLAGYEFIGAERWPPAIVSPLHGGLPVTRAARSTYFDTLYHADLIVGLNTSALVEASILGKGSFTIGDPGHTAGQQQTLHYHYLTAAKLLHEASDFEAHFSQLGEALRDGADRSAATAFVSEFIRPHGREIAATPLFVEAIEAELGKPAVATEAPAGSAMRIAIDAFAYCDDLAIRCWRALRRLTGYRNAEDGVARPNAESPAGRVQDAK